MYKFFQLFLTFLLNVEYVISGKAHPSQMCASFTENGWVSSDPSRKICFSFFKTFRTWWDAEETCRKEGMVLATPSSESIDRFLYQKEHDVFVGDFFWIGAINRESKGWKWSNGERWEYHNFEVVKKALDGLFGFFKKTTSCALFGFMYWRKEDCHHLAPFVCQSKTSPILRLPGNKSAITDQDALAGVDSSTWICSDEESLNVNPSGRFCFIYHEVKSTWWQANKTCEGNGMSLVAINDIYVYDFLRLHIRKASIMDFWIGAINNGYGWRWANGAQVTFKVFTILTLNWEFIFKDTRCALFGLLGWLKRGCDHLAPFVCQLIRNKPFLLAESLGDSGNMLLQGASNYSSEPPRQAGSKKANFQRKKRIFGVKNPKLSAPGRATRMTSSLAECARICAADKKCVLVNFCLGISYCVLYGNYDLAVSGEVTSEAGCVVYVNTALANVDSL